MKRKLLWVRWAVWLGLQLATGRAAELNVAVADRMRILESYADLKQALGRLNEQEAQQTAQHQQQANRLEALQQAVRQLTLDAQNVVASASEREQAGSKAESMQGELRAAETALKRFDENNRRQITANMQALRQKYFTAVQAQIKAYAAEHHLALILDSSALATQNGVGGVLHADAQLDITAAIIARVNAPAAAATNAPAGLQK